MKLRINIFSNYSNNRITIAIGYHSEISISSITGTHVKSYLKIDEEGRIALEQSMLIFLLDYLNQKE